MVVGTYKEPLLVERTFGENHLKDLIYRQLHNRLKENRTIPNIIVFLHPALTIKPAKDTPCNLKRIFHVPSTSSRVRPSGRSGTSAGLTISLVGSVPGVVAEFLVVPVACSALGDNEVVGFRRGATVFRLDRSTLDLPLPSSASDRDPLLPFGLLEIELGREL